MRIIADTSVLVRVIVQDNPRQARTAQNALKQAETIVVSLVSLCELVWALLYHYDSARGDIAAAVRQLLTIRNLEIDLVGANAGLAMLEAGGDFADGVIAYDGLRLGGETFVSFDRKAVTLLKDQGQSAHLLK
jgi:predicted nucleic-acid-binding protein